jgi:DNA-binding response OmpR family regulator
MNRKYTGIHRVLVIDDDRDDFDLISEAMQEIDPEMQLEFVYRFQDADQYLTKDIDLIMLDLNMPLCDGFCWLRSIREDRRIDLPVVIYTNSQSPAHMMRAYEEGADLYFNKPESFPALVNALRTLMNLDWSNPLAVKHKYSEDKVYKSFAWES